jgi:hypothetical protein
VKAPTAQDIARETAQRESIFHDELPFASSPPPGSASLGPAAPVVPSGPPSNACMTADSRYLYLLTEHVTEEKRWPEQKKEPASPAPPKASPSPAPPPPPPPPTPTPPVKEKEPQPIIIKTYTYKLTKYDGENDLAFVSCIVLQGSPALPRHDQIVCDVRSLSRSFLKSC